MKKSSKELVDVELSSLDLYREISFESSIISITNQKGIIIKANERFCEISGYSVEELVGSSHSIVNSGHHPKSFFEEMWTTILNGETWKGEICNRNKNGSHYWVETRIHPTWNNSLKEYEFISIRLEVTHRKKFEEILNGVEQVARIGYWEWNIESNNLFWSSMIYDIHGLDPESHTPSVEQGIQSYAPSSRPIIQKALENSLQTGEGYDLELQLLHSNGEPVWVRAVGQCEVINGKATRAFGTFQDINQKKLTDLQLDKSQQHLNLALESAGIGNWVYYPSEDKLVWDDASFSIFGVEKERFNGKYKDWLDCLHPEDIEQSSRSFLDCVENKRPVYDNRFRIIHPKLGVRFIKGRANISYNEKGEPVEIIGLNWDISKDIIFQNKLVEAREKALEATRAKSAFLATMSHEIRTPMNGMMGTLELLSDTNLSQGQKEYIDTVQMCGQQLLTIVNDILDFSKIEAGKLELEYRDFDLPKLVKGIKAMFEVQALKKNLSLNIIIDERVPKVIKGDDTRLKQVLTNLVSNAFKFTEEGTIKIEVLFDKKRSSKSTATLMFKVVDTGMGIPLEKQGRLFQSFRQVDDTTTRKFGGSGLGLAICNSLVSSMGGHIGVESDEGAGAIFFFDIMVGLGQEKELEKNNKNDRSGSFKNDLRVLIAEDNAINQRLALSFLTKLGLDEQNLETAENGQEAWEKTIEAFKNDEGYDLIFMDMQMPIMDGVEATENIIRDLHSDSPIIFAMTANVFEEDKRKCLKAGMKSFISKPIKKAVLLETLCEFFPQKVDEIQQSINEGIIMEASKSKYSYIDEEKIVYEFEDDFDIFEELVEDYREQFSNFVTVIKEGLNNKDANEIMVAGHTLKGIVSNFYSEKLRQAAHEIEICGKESDFESVDEKLGVFVSLNELTLKELDTFIKEKTGKSQAA